MIAVKASGEEEELRYLYAMDGSMTASISGTDVLEYTYDKRGYVASVIKNNSHVIKLDYDGNGNLSILTERRSGNYSAESIAGYIYDTAGNLVEVRKDGTVSYKASGVNRDGYTLYSEKMEGGTLLAAYQSYPDGLLKQVTDGAGNRTSYQYGKNKEMTGLTINSPDGSLVYREINSYDKNGSLLTQSISGAEYNNETLKYTYDALDRLVSETKNVDCGEKCRHGLWYHMHRK